MSMKNSSDTIGNRTRDLPACSAVPQPAAPPRVSLNNPQTFSPIRQYERMTECWTLKGPTVGGTRKTCVRVSILSVLIRKGCEQMEDTFRSEPFKTTLMHNGQPTIHGIN